MAKEKSKKGKKKGASSKTKPRKTNLMKKYEKETGSNAIWGGAITQGFKDWKKENSKAPRVSRSRKSKKSKSKKSKQKKSKSKKGKKKKSKRSKKSKKKESKKKKSKRKKSTKKSGKECDDKKCPEHGGLKLHGRVFEGTVVSDKMQRTVSVQWPRKQFVPKYERYLLTRSKIKAHNPPCVEAKIGDKVRIAECRPISKTVNFVVIEVLGEEK